MPQHDAGRRRRRAHGDAGGPAQLSQSSGEAAITSVAGPTRYVPINRASASASPEFKETGQAARGRDPRGC